MTTLTLERTFAALVEQWRRETTHLSSIQRMVLHPAYQRIIGLGPDAIPLILREMQQRPDHWFWALQAIAREDPVPRGSTFKEATAAWLSWGHERGLIGEPR